MLSVSRETLRQLEQYHALMVRWNRKINLISAKTLPEFMDRHVADCVQVAECAGAPTGRWVDLGTGGGLPGIVLAIVFAESQLRFTLIESDLRKCAFLQTVIRELKLANVSVLSQRIEAAQPQAAEIISARALAPLPLLLSYVHRHLRPDGTAWLMKGRSWRQEIEEASSIWRFQVDSFPSRTDPEAAILKISGVSNA